MPHAKVAKQVLRTARKTTRHPDRSSSTKRRLIESATELFTERGYAGTSLDEVVAASRVTKGALYHHFSSKLSLFESVFERVQRDAVAEIQAVLDEVRDPWERAEAGFESFLAACRKPEFRRICMQEGPVALGHERWQELEREAAYGIVVATVTDLLADLGAAEELAEAFSAIFYGSLRSSAEFVADAEDPDAASDEAAAAIGIVLTGIRQLGATLASEGTP